MNVDFGFKKIFNTINSKHVIFYYPVFINNLFSLLLLASPLAYNNCQPILAIRHHCHKPFFSHCRYYKKASVFVLGKTTRPNLAFVSIWLQKIKNNKLNNNKLQICHFSSPFHNIFSLLYQQVAC
jgi:hypothetical protein